MKPISNEEMAKIKDYGDFSCSAGNWIEKNCPNLPADKQIRLLSEYGLEDAAHVLSLLLNKINTLKYILYALDLVKHIFKEVFPYSILLDDVLTSVNNVIDNDTELSLADASTSCRFSLDCKSHAEEQWANCDNDKNGNKYRWLATEYICECAYDLTALAAATDEGETYDHTGYDWAARAFVEYQYGVNGVDKKISRLEIMDKIIKNGIILLETQKQGEESDI